MLVLAAIPISISCILLRRPSLENDNWWRGHAAAFLKHVNLPFKTLRRGRVCQVSTESYEIILTIKNLLSEITFLNCLMSMLCYPRVFNICCHGTLDYVIFLLAPSFCFENYIICVF